MPEGRDARDVVAALAAGGGRRGLRDVGTDRLVVVFVVLVVAAVVLAGAAKKGDDLDVSSSWRDSMQYYELPAW